MNCGQSVIKVGDKPEALLGSRSMGGALGTARRNDLHALAARRRFYEILESASITGPLAASIHVGLVALLRASCRVDLDLHRAHRLVSDPASHYYVPDIRDRKAEALRLFHDGDAINASWIPDHLHFNYLREYAPQDLARQLDAASVAARAGVHGAANLFTGYADLPLHREQLLALLDITCKFDPELQLKMRSFRAPFPVDVRAAVIA